MMDSTKTLYDAWDEDGVRELRDHHDERAFQTSFTSSFTAINRSQTQSTSQSSVTLSLHEAETQSTTERRRRRNPTVARYLGLESFEAPTQLNVSENTSRSPPRKTQRKRRKVEHTARASSPGSIPVSHQNAPVQPRVSENLRRTKPCHKTVSSSGRPALESSARNEIVHTTGADPQHEQRWCQGSRSTAQNIAAEAGTTGEHTSSNAYNDYGANVQSYKIPNIDDCDTDSDGHSHDQQLDHGGALLDEDEFDDDLDDEEFLKLASDVIDTGAKISTLSEPLSDPGLLHKVNDDHRPSSSTDTSYALSETDNFTQLTAKKFVSPMTMTTRLLAATSDVDRAEARKPIVRPSFPAAVRDRSPIIGLSSNSVLRTCFRIGEAINQAHHSSKSGKHVVFELYARIFDSQRDETKQHFTFCDLFHGKPPHIKAVYEGMIWKSVQLFDYDSKRLLQPGRICRCIGTMKREDKQWTLTVLNIWESTWEDIKWVEGIVNP